MAVRPDSGDRRTAGAREGADEHPKAPLRLRDSRLPSSARREHPVLRPYEVKVEWLRIDAFRPGLVALRELLSPEERERAERFGAAADRETFVITRAILRTILGRHLGQAPRRVRFRSGPQGKPILEEAGDADLRFNVSHSGGVAALALTRSRRVGIDVEQIRPDFPWREVAGSVFTRRELAAFDAIPPDRQPQAFFGGWTRKEAFVKARGLGFSLSPQEFSVSLPPYQPALLEVAGDPEEAARWSFAPICLAAGFAAAVVAEGDDWLLKCHQLIPDPRDPGRIR